MRVHRTEGRHGDEFGHGVGDGVAALTTWASAADFDGSKALICATVEAHACGLGEVCLRDLPDGFGVPQFMRINFANKTIAGPKRSTEIRSIEKGSDQLLMQGNELGYGWTIVLDQDRGDVDDTG